MLEKILIANRGEIARRIARTARRLGVRTVAVYSDADARALHVADADEAVHIGPSPATDSYLRGDKIIAAAKATGAQAIHPGYGFLSENADFAAAVAAAGLKFIGPCAEAMRALGGKAAAKEIAIKAGVPVVPGYQGPRQDAEALAAEARKIGYPVMIKAVAGGGGRGMRLVANDAELPELLASARREAEGAFGDGRVLIEKVVVAPRHIEVQVFGDAHGNVVHLFERDCTLQRRNQKVVEEAPAPGMSPDLRERMCAAAVKLAMAVGYEGAGTVEFLVEGGSLGADARWYFIEMNTRLQVEHPVTEEITGLDLVEWQLRVASGERLPLTQDQITMSGHAVEVRLCAEDPAQGFLPSIGRIAAWWAEGATEIRLETGVAKDSVVSPFYDSMIAKLIGRGTTRGEAIAKVRSGLAHIWVGGIKTNAAFLDRLLSDPDVQAFRMDTGLIARRLPELTAFVLDPSRLECAVDTLLGQRVGSLYDTAGSAALPGPWDASDGFQLGTVRRQQVRLLVDGTPHAFAVDWQGGRARLADRTAALRQSTVVISSNDEDRRRIYALQDLVHVEIAWPAHDASAADNGHAGDHIRAPINGKVAKVFVAEGDAVEKGARIAVVEAMKMEHVLHAARAGQIAKIAAREGQQVNQGAVIASLAEEQA